tara:strand:- start:2719 stop:3078 length:360 start_codon:yes stop_codon:yes gene_type:complete
MAHFAELDSNNVVLRVIVINNAELLDENNVEQESLGISFCQTLFGGTWKQTSYNSNLRKNFAGVGFSYDSDRDAFIEPKPYASWTLNETSCRWEAPVSLPTDGNRYTWNEETTSWDVIE